MSVHYEDDTIRLLCGNALEEAAQIENKSVRTIITSPPYYGLRDYGREEQIGTEAFVGEYVQRLVDLFSELRRTLTDDGTLWLNLGDSYAGSRSGAQGGTGAFAYRAVAGERVRNKTLAAEIGKKQLIGVPWKVAFALQEDGWVLRSDIIWAKTNPMPESINDRPTRSHEYMFLLAKSTRYFYDAQAIKEPDSGRGSGNNFVRPERMSVNPGSEDQWTPGDGRNKRDVWTVSTQPFAESHFAVYPPELIRPCVLAGSEPGDLVLDPFSGSGTTGMVATQEGRRYVGIDINSDYLDLSLRTRFRQPTLGGVA